MTRPEPSRRDTAAAAQNGDFNLFPGYALEEKPLFVGLYESIRDAFFPPHLPPLELTSKPIPILDRMANKTNPWAVGTSTVVNGGILAMVLILGIHTAIKNGPPSHFGSHIDLGDLTIFAPPQAHAAHGGGSGGSDNPVDPIRGRNPKLESTPLLPPIIPQLEHPQLTVDPSIAVQNIQLPDNSSMPNIGAHTSVNVRLLSYGPGTHDGIGIGANGGDGPGKGIGYGPGSDRGAGDGPYTVGGGVTAPIPIVTPEAEFSDQARRQRYQGICLISVIIDAHGYPQNPRVVQALGMGLDEKALDAVRRYRFKPATNGGRPVPVRITVEVDFRLF